MDMCFIYLNQSALYDISRIHYSGCYNGSNVLWKSNIAKPYEEFLSTDMQSEDEVVVMKQLMP